MMTFTRYRRYALALAGCLAVAGATLPTAIAHAATTAPRSPASPASSPHWISLSDLRQVPVKGRADTNYFEIKNAAHELCLDAAGSGDGTNGDKIELWQCNGGSNQMWAEQGIDSFWVNQAHGLCLDAADPGLQPGEQGGLYNGDKVQLWKCNSGYNQFWVGNAYFQEMNGANEVFCLDAVESGDGTNGDPVQVWQCSSNEPRGAYQQVW
jgi:hypothetical protein